MHIRASHILVENKHEAEDLQRKIKEGVAFAELAKKHSQCPSKQQGGDLGSFSKGQMVAEFEAAAFALDVQEISAPVRTAFGYHLILRTE